jgi:hypothetical protein
LPRLREDDLRALLRPEDFRLELFLALLRADLPLLFFADRLPLFFADLPPLFFADLPPLFLVDRPADRLELFRDDFLADPRADDFLLDFLADLRRGWDVVVRLRADSSESSYEEGEDAGAEAGLLSIGSGSIQPEPDQPISI